VQVFWSVRGGAGVSVVAALAGLGVAHRASSAVLVDLDGDLPSILGIDAPQGPGLGEWSRAPSDLPFDALGHLEVPVVPGLALLPSGAAPVSPDRVGLLRSLLASDARTVIVDAGQLGAAPERVELARAAEASVLVTSACPAALRRLTELPAQPSGIVVVHRHVCRAGGSSALARTVGAPIVAELDHDAALARAVDLGLLGRRLPRRVQRVAGSLS
jgi:hypothetical protein